MTHKATYMKIELKNSFHVTSTTVRAEPKECGDYVEIELTPRQISRASRKLCGMLGCTCRYIAGTRGWQEVGGKPLSILRKNT